LRVAHDNTRAATKVGAASFLHKGGTTAAGCSGEERRRTWWMSTTVDSAGHGEARGGTDG